MKILKNIRVPTGNILVVEGEKGKLECLSIGDYGKDINLKCDSMGLTREPDRVRHTKLLPLEDKWVITISTQYGCSMGCNFCDVPKVGKGKNATFNDLINQVKVGIGLHPEVVQTNRLNLHYARMGEPSWNPQVIEATKYLKGYMDAIGFKFHPVVSTMMPNNTMLDSFIESWMHMKNGLLEGEAGLQLSINSTSESERIKMFNDKQVCLSRVSEIMYEVFARQGFPLGRKITLNFAVANYEVDAARLAKLFDPRHFIVKLTPMHKTVTALENDIKTEGDYTEYYPYKELEENLKKEGFDVLVFIASEEEDLGRITCGNAILSGTMPECDHEIM